jgi:hypothetical protein
MAASESSSIGAPSFGSFRPSIVKPAPEWQLRRRNLLSLAKSDSLGSAALEQERDRAFALLERVTCAGTLPVCECSLHVLLAPVFCHSAVDLASALVQHSCDPTDAIERCGMVLAEVVHGRPQEQLRSAAKSSGDANPPAV